MDDKTTSKKRKVKAVKDPVNGEVLLVRKGMPRTGHVQLPDIQTFLKQPNIVTLMTHDYSNLQLRAFISVIEALQITIEESINKESVEQLVLFQEFQKSDKIKLTIPTANFGVEPGNYPKLKNCLKQLATIPVELDAKDPITGADAWVVKGLLQAYIPKGTYQRNITIEIDKDIAKLLVNVDKGFTKYMKEIAISSESKYTPRIYMLISSWKDKGGFSITIHKFRNWLKLEKKYSAYKDLYKRILRPAYEELHEKADCWFEVNEICREDEKEPYKLNFKVIKASLSAAEKEWFETQRKNIEGILYRHMGLRGKDLEEVLKQINFSNVIHALNKLYYLSDHLDEIRKKATNLSQYVKTAMLNALATTYEEIDSEEYANYSEISQEENGGN